MERNTMGQHLNTENIDTTLIARKMEKTSKASSYNRQGTNLMTKFRLGTQKNLYKPSLNLPVDNENGAKSRISNVTQNLVDLEEVLPFK